MCDFTVNVFHIITGIVVILMSISLMLSVKQLICLCIRGLGGGDGRRHFTSVENLPSEEYEGPSRYCF